MSVSIPASASLAASSHPAAQRVSARGVALVALAHLALLGLLMNFDTPPLATPSATLTVDLIAAEPAAAAKPTPPAPSRPQPRTQPAQLAAPKEAASIATVSEPPTPLRASSPGTPAKAAASEATSAVSAPRFDADYLHNPTPVYPAMARRMGEEGRVMLRVFVEASGRAGQVEVQGSSGSPRLDGAAQEAVWRWRFVPARRGDEAVDAWVMVPIVFNLRG
ncbi:energy transducer TonB [Rhodocyclus purpureus]|uniref:energy transducer TonB n=1 Tax=Rhodocyclus purpureus TaxID=1067 RepID=UPI001F5C4216|nr:energy transducer TonB [Rhodocyclus purpureus]MBK5915396.1 hypothetical protein [Rhodocyclus purpureus]